MTIANRAVARAVSCELKPNPSIKEVDTTSMTIKTANEISEGEVCPLLDVFYFTTSYRSHFSAAKAANVAR